MSFLLWLNHWKLKSFVMLKLIQLMNQIMKYHQMKAQAPKERQRRAVGVNGTYECDQCHKIYSGPGALYNHKQSAHHCVKYACNQCDYQATTQGSLTVHI